jgi:4-amino-4-deoxy-L-arabinose transferase-like glycosyltransferase
MKEPDPPGWLGLLLLAGLVLIALTYRDYGSNWDEAIQARYGELAVSYFSSGGTDTRCNELADLRFYGPLVEMIPALIYGDAKTGKYELRHLLIALIGLATLPAVFGYASLARIPGLPLFSVLALATMPRFYGDGFNNSKDVPFACLFAWSMYALAARFRARTFTPWQAVACGVAFGLALNARPGGFPLLVVFLAAATILGYATAHRRERAAVAALHGLGALVIAWVLMVLPWPWAHQNPLRNPLEAMRVAASFTTSYPVLFDGAVVSSGEIPRYYLLKYLAIATPPVVLLLCLVGIVAGLLRARRDPGQSFLFLLTFLWLVIPLALFVIVRPNVYDGIRHFLFVLPAIAIGAAYGATWLCDRLAGSRARSLARVLCAALLLLPVKDLIALHPYQTTYFNGFVGGVAGADGKYETDYWLTSYREAIGWVNEQAAQRPGETVTVAVAGDGLIVPWVNAYAGPNVHPRVVASPPATPLLPDGVDYYIATKRWGFDRGFPAAPVVHTIGRAGAVFTVIKGRPRFRRLTTPIE